MEGWREGGREKGRERKGSGKRRDVKYGESQMMKGGKEWKEVRSGRMERGGGWGRGKKERDLARGFPPSQYGRAQHVDLVT